MKKILLALAIFSFGASSAFAWGHSFLKPHQNWQNYRNCVNTANTPNGLSKHKILADWACQKFYGVTTNNGGKPIPKS